MSASSSPNSQPVPSGERLLRTARLRRRRDFLRVQSEGRRVRTEHFMIMVLPTLRVAAAPPASPEPRVGRPTRMGVTVTKRVANAVGRNRVKRLVREVFRRNREFFPSDCEVVWIARTGAELLDYAAVRGELVQARGALARAGAAGQPRPTASETRR